MVIKQASVVSKQKKKNYDFLSLLSQKPLFGFILTRHNPVFKVKYNILLDSVLNFLESKWKDTEGNKMSSSLENRSTESYHFSIPDTSVSINHIKSVSQLF